MPGDPFPRGWNSSLPDRVSCRGPDPCGLAKAEGRDSKAVVSRRLAPRCTQQGIRLDGKFGRMLSVASLVLLRDTVVFNFSSPNAIESCIGSGFIQRRAPGDGGVSGLNCQHEKSRLNLSRAIIMIETHFEKRFKRNLRRRKVAKYLPRVLSRLMASPFGPTLLPCSTHSHVYAAEPESSGSRAHTTDLWYVCSGST